MSETSPIWPASAARAADWPRLAEVWDSLRHDLALKAASGAPAGRRLCQLVFDRGSDPFLVSRQPWLSSGVDEHLRDPQCDLFAAALAVRDVVERHVPAAHVSVRRLCAGLGCHGTRYVRHARGWYAYGVRTVAQQLPCASGKYATQKAGTRSLYVQYGGPGTYV